MDSNKANTGTFYLTVVLVILTVILVLLGLAVWLYPNPKPPTLPGGVLMKAFLGICILVVVCLQVLVAYLIRGKLRKQVAELTRHNNELEAELSKVVPPDSEEIQRLKFEIQGLNGELVANAQSAEQTRGELESDKRDLERQNTNLSKELDHEQKLREVHDRSMEISRQELREVSGKLDTQLEEYGKFDKALREKSDEINTLNQKLHEAEHEAKQADLRANEEKNSKDSIYELYQKSERKLGDWAWLTKMAEDQKIEIDNYVMLDTITLGEMNLAASVPFVRFAIHIVNKSVLHISLDYKLKDEIGGAIRFEDIEGIELVRTKRVINTVRDVIPGGTGCLTIEQFLSHEEAKAIDKAKGSDRAKFDFNDLVVNICGGQHSPNITLRPLKIKNTFLVPFPVDMQTRAKRIKALSQVWGRGVQLYEPLRTGNEPLPKDLIENWQSGALTILEREGYGEEGARRIFDEISHGTPFPMPEAGSSSQRNWLHFCFVVLEDLISREIKHYTYS